MDFKRFSRHRIWRVLSRFIDKTTMQIPITLLIIPLLFSDWRWGAILPLTMIVDFTLHGAAFLNQHYVSYLKLKRNLSLFQDGKYEVLKSPLIEQFNTIINSFYNNNLVSVFFLKKDIAVIRTKLKYKFTTIPDLSGISIIAVKHNYNENSDRDKILLAHEYGHIYHPLIRYKDFLLPIVLSIYQIILLLCAINGGSWLIFIIFLPLVYFVIWQSIYFYKSRLESDANITALQLIEKTWGVDIMRYAASTIMGLLITSSITKKKEKDQISVDRCIADLAPFLFNYDRNIYIMESEKRTKNYLIDKTLEPEILKKKLANEETIRNFLKTNDFWQSSLNLVLQVRSYVIIIIYIACLIAVLFSISAAFVEINYKIGWNSIIIFCISLLVYIFSFSLIKTIVWKKKTKLQEQIGL